MPVPLWAVPEGTPIGAGEFLFTPEGELAGLVIDRGGVPVLIPGEAVVGAADRLLTQPADTTGGLGIEVQPLSSTLRQATGATAGVVVTRVDPHGPSAGLLATGDVIESIDGTTVGTREQWDAWLSRAEPGRRATLDVRSQGTVRSIGIETASVPDRRSTLGLTLVAESGLGSAVQWVERFTAGERAGLRRGDLITAAGDVQAPPPGEIRRLYAALSGGESLLLGVTRGTTHLVVALAP
ncbi:MAG: PDZ domain-containing protein [Acidimicrobiia bacterium]|nr:PDZ domain-containing protein [Acidimicrobiia bacterium]